MKPTSWYHQGVLKLTEEQWLDALKNPRIFDENVLKIVQYVQYVFHQPGYVSTRAILEKLFMSIAIRSRRGTGRSLRLCI